jgi:hypothetical protein
MCSSTTKIDSKSRSFQRIRFFRPIPTNRTILTSVENARGCDNYVSASRSCISRYPARAVQESDVIEAAATYSFRIRFKRAPGFTLNANQQRQVLPDLQSGISLTLCAADLEKPIEQSEHLAFIGDGFNSVDEAQVAGTRFGEALLVTFASFRARIPVDFGWRGPVHPDAVVYESMRNRRLSSDRDD